MVTSVFIHSAVVFGSIQNIGLENRDKIHLFMSIFMCKRTTKIDVNVMAGYSLSLHVSIIRHTDGIQSGTRPEMYLLFVRAHPLMA